MLQTAEWTFRLASSKKEDQSPVLTSVTHSPPKMFPSHLLLFLLFPTCHFFTIVFQYFVQYSQYFMQYAVKNRQSFYPIFFIATIRSLKYKWQIEIKNGNQLSWAINKAEPRASHSVGEWPSHGWWTEPWLVSGWLWTDGGQSHGWWSLKEANCQQAWQPNGVTAAATRRPYLSHSFILFLF